MDDWHVEHVEHVGFERDDAEIGGLEVWKHLWRRIGTETVRLPHPTHPDQVHSYDVYEIGDLKHPVRFAACDLSNGVWGFYVLTMAAKSRLN